MVLSGRPSPPSSSPSSTPKTSKHCFSHSGQSNQTSSNMIGSKKGVGFSLPFHLCRWGRAEKPRSVKWPGDDTSETSKTAAAPSSSWWSRPRSDLKAQVKTQTQLIFIQMKTSSEVTAHLHPDEVILRGQRLWSGLSLSQQFWLRCYRVKTCLVVMETLTCDLFVGQWRDGQSWAELLEQALIQPIKVFVAMIDRSVGWLEEDVSVYYCVLKHVLLYILVMFLTLGVIWYSMKLFSPYSLDSLLGSAITQSRGANGYNQTGPTSPIWRMMSRKQQHSLLQWLVKLSTHIDWESVGAVCWRFGWQENFRAWTFGERKPENTNTTSVMKAGLLWPGLVIPVDPL